MMSIPTIGFLLLACFIAVYITPSLATDQECRGKVDILICMDSSNSINSVGWGRQKNFFVDLVGSFNYSAVRFAVMTFSSAVKVIGHFKSFTSQAEVQAAIQNTTQLKQNTNTSGAFDVIVADGIFQEKNGDRPDASNLIIVCTDGRPDNVQAAYKSARVAEKIADALIMTIGVGSVDKDVLVNLASSDDLSYSVRSFGAINEIKDIVKATVCQTTPPPPTAAPPPPPPPTTAAPPPPPPPTTTAAPPPPPPPPPPPTTAAPPPPPPPTTTAAPPPPPPPTTDAPPPPPPTTTATEPPPPPPPTTTTEPPPPPPTTTTEPPPPPPTTTTEPPPPPPPTTTTEPPPPPPTTTTEPPPPPPTTTTEPPPPPPPTTTTEPPPPPPPTTTTEPPPPPPPTTTAAPLPPPPTTAAPPPTTAAPPPPPPPTTTPPPPPTTTTQKPCIKDNTCLNLLLVVDSSGSIGYSNYQQNKPFLRKVIAALARFRLRVGILYFGTNAYVAIAPTTNLIKVDQAIENLGYRNSSTHTDKGIIAAQAYADSFTDCPTLMVVNTDGQSTYPDRTTAAAASSKAKGTVIAVFAIGSETDPAELVRIASPGLVYNVKDYSQLANAADSITAVINC